MVQARTAEPFGGGEPVVELDARYGDEKVQAIAWPTIRDRLAAAELYWLSTVRPDGRPHVTPLIGVWSDGALVFCTGPGERKARNLEENRHCVLTTGTNTLHEGIDIVLGGDAVPVADDHRLRHLAEVYEEKYGAQWRFQVRDGGFWHGGDEDGHLAMVFAVAPVTVFGFGKDPYSQSRYRFDGR
jgi:Pyridoxamine 5'-phosphate oxidase